MLELMSTSKGLHCREVLAWKQPAQPWTEVVKFHAGKFEAVTKQPRQRTCLICAAGQLRASHGDMDNPSG